MWDPLCLCVVIVLCGVLIDALLSHLTNSLFSLRVYVCLSWNWETIRINLSWVIRLVFVRAAHMCTAYDIFCYFYHFFTVCSYLICELCRYCTGHQSSVSDKLIFVRMTPMPNFRAVTIPCCTDSILHLDMNMINIQRCSTYWSHHHHQKFLLQNAPNVW